MKKLVLIPTIGMLFAGALMVLPSCSPVPKEQEPIVEDVGPAPTFEEERSVDFRLYDLKDDGDEPVSNAPQKLVIHYHNDNNDCLTRRFYTWVVGIPGVERKPDEATWSASDMTITLNLADYEGYSNTPGLYFIIKFVGTWDGQSEDTYIDWNNYEIDDSGTMEVWTIPGEAGVVDVYNTEEETKFAKVKTAKFTDWKTIHCVADEAPKSYELYAFDKEYLRSSTYQQVALKEFRLLKSDTNISSKEFDITFNYTVRINVQYVLFTKYNSHTREQKIIVSCENLYKTSRFTTYYNYFGDDLGVTYTPTKTTFKVWSPVSALVDVNIYNNGTPRSYSDKDHRGDDACVSYHMNYTAGGVWQITLENADLAGKFYTYTFLHSAGNVESIDPYAKACGINGIRGYIYDNKSDDANPTGWDTVPSVWHSNSEYKIDSPQDLSIYEVHIRDLTMDETWVSKTDTPRGTFDAFSEPGTTYSLDGKTVTTGFDHIKELGVNAIQLTPVFDHDDDERPEKMSFNWGYNPLNYNCVEGGYSSDPYDPLARIKEYKNLIKSYALNGNHTRVIMDVVYNHVSSASASCFNKAMPRYYFRYDSEWNYLNASGCNNEVATDAPMMSKYIVDSLYWWATEYKVKGFRFDLMGMIDWMTLKTAKEKLAAYDPDIYLYGEGWTGNFGEAGAYHGSTAGGNDGTRTDVAYQKLYESSTSAGYVGAFNDSGRDNLKGSNDGGFGSGSKYPGYGYISKSAGTGDWDVKDHGSKVANMMLGKYGNPETGSNPKQTVNYASCHDNYTLFDQLKYTLGDGSQRDSRATPLPNSEPDIYEVIDASIACHAAIMMSNGVGFMQGGEELYRTKTIPEEEVVRLNGGKSLAYLKTDAAQSDESLVCKPYPWFRSWDEASADNGGKGPKPTDILCGDEVVMYNNDIITHNSYKSIDAVNSFKWDRKIKVGDTDVTGYWGIWKQIIEERNKIKKHEFGDDTVNIYGGGVSYGASVLGIWNGFTSQTGYSFFLGGRSGGDILVGSNFETSNTFVFGVGSRNVSGENLWVSKYGFACYKK